MTTTRHGPSSVKAKRVLAPLAPLARMLAGIGGVLEEVVTAYRSGGGVPYARYGTDFRRHYLAQLPFSAHDKRDLLAATFPGRPDLWRGVSDADIDATFERYRGSIDTTSQAFARITRGMNLAGLDGHPRTVGLEQHKVAAGVDVLGETRVDLVSKGDSHLPAERLEAGAPGAVDGGATRGVIVEGLEAVQERGQQVLA